MADRDSATFKLRFEHRQFAESSDRTRGEDPRSRFWQPFLSSERAVPVPLSIDKLERSILRGSFAAALATRISRAADVMSRQRDESAGFRVSSLRRLSRADFSVTVVGKIRYGSAEISVFLTGAKRVAEAFNNDFELFRTLLEAYAPDAWNQALPTDSVELTCDVMDADGLKALFQQQLTAAPATAPAGASPAEDEKARRLRWLWIVSNTSLILPCLLALAVLYAVSQHVSHFESNVADRMGRLEAREGELLKIYQARETELHKALLDAVKLASTRATEPACCCHTHSPGPGKPQPKDSNCKKAETQAAASAPSP